VSARAVASSSAQAASSAATFRSKWSQMKADAAARMDRRSTTPPGRSTTPGTRGAGRGRAGVRAGVLGGQVDVDLGLVDALAQLLAGLGDGGLGGLLGLGGALLEVVELRREVHSSSICWVQYRAPNTPSWRSLLHRDVAKSSGYLGLLRSEGGLSSPAPGDSTRTGLWRSGWGSQAPSRVPHRPQTFPASTVGVGPTGRSRCRAAAARLAAPRGTDFG